jgi:hypothetical protein
MPHPEAPVESSIYELGAALRARVARPGLLEFLRRSLQIREFGCALGLPRRLSPAVFERWLGTPHVFIALSSQASFDGALCEVALPPEQALDLVDRVLGASGRTMVPGQSCQPTAAECGVLAYFAARCVRACEAELRVQDVRTTPRGANGADAVLWPLRVTAPAQDLKLDLKLILAAPASYPEAPIAARLSLSDSLGDVALPTLESGDLLLSDRWSLYATASGLSGLLELCVEGSHERALVTLEGEVLRLAPGATRAGAGGQAELVLSRLALGFGDLAALMDGASLPCPRFTHATLEAQDAVLAHGQLVRWRGQLALEVEAREAADKDRDHSTR